MAPGLNGRQAGTVPKNKTRNAGSHRTPRDTANAGSRTSSLDWDQVSEHAGRQSRRRTDQSAPDSDRESNMTSQPQVVDNDNGEVSWNGLDEFGAHSSGSSRQSSHLPRWATNTLANNTAAALDNGPGDGQSRGQPLDSKQVRNKLTQIQDYIRQTTQMMNALKAHNTCGPPTDHHSRQKLNPMLGEHFSYHGSMPASGAASIASQAQTESDEVLRLTEESKRKMDSLEKRKQELLTLRDRAREQLEEAQAEQERLLARSSSLNLEIVANRNLIDVTAHRELSQRLRSAQDMFHDQEQIESALAGTDDLEHHLQSQQGYDDQGELSDAETDYMMVKGKVAELMNMKAQLAHIQRMMATITQEEREGRSQDREATPIATPAQHASASVLKLEHAKAKLVQLNQLREMIEHAQGSNTLPAGLLEAVSAAVNDEPQSTVSSSPSPSLRSGPRQAQHHFKQLLQSEDSDSEAPCLLDAAAGTGQSNARSASPIPSPFVCGTLPPRVRQRAVWNMAPSTSSITSQDRSAKNSKTRSRGSSQSAVRNHGRGQKEERRDAPERSERGDRAVSENQFLDNLLQTQRQLEASGSLCERMLQESSGAERGGVPSADVTAMLVNQHQTLSRTVSQCIQLLGMQQQQIAELRSALAVQSSVVQNQSSQQAMLNQSHHNSLHMAPPPFLPTNQPASFPSYDWTGHPYPPAYALPTSTNLNNMGNRIHSLGCLAAGPEEMGPSGALNNQVPPGNRANNYWDNFRSYSRQNLLSTSKSNEETDSSRRLARDRHLANQERTMQDGSIAIGAPNNQSALNNPIGASQPPRLAVGLNLTNQTAADVAAAAAGGGASTSEQFILPTNQRSNHTQITRSRSVEPQNLKNELPARNLAEADPRCLNPRTDRNVDRFHAEVPETLRSVRNDTGATSRNCGSGDGEAAQASGNKRRVDKPRSRNETRGNLKNRSDINSGLSAVLRDNVFSEMTNFVRANETHPHFLIQLFRDLQQVTSDSQRQRTLETIHDAVGNTTNLNLAANNHRSNSNNQESSRSNLNRSDEAGRLDQLFMHLRENQNAIRLGLAQGGNNISNLRDLTNAPRTSNNLQHSDGLRDLRTYFEANLCNFGHNSALENPNLSNIRENLTRGPRAAAPSGAPAPDPSEYQNTTPKNVYGSLFDSLVEDLRRRTQDEYYDVPQAVENIETRPPRRYEMMDRADFVNDRDLNDSGIDVNVSNAVKNYMGEVDQRKCRGAAEEQDEEEDLDLEEGAVALMSPNWLSPEVRPQSLIPPVGLLRNLPLDSYSMVVHLSSNRDLAEADQSRTGESSGAESDSGFVNLQNLYDPAAQFAAEPESNFAVNRLYKPEAEAQPAVDSEAAAASGTKGVPKARKPKPDQPKPSTNKFRDAARTEEEERGGSEAGLDEAAAAGAGSLPTPTTPRPESRTMMNMAGSLEHFSCQEEDNGTDLGVGGGGRGNLGTSPEAQAEAEVEADWEMENGLDQVPTRLEKND